MVHTCYTSLLKDLVKVEEIKRVVSSGVVTQCLVPARINDQYLTNLLLKINAKVKDTQ